MDQDGVTKLLNELSKEVGELHGKTSLILQKLERLEKRFNDYSEKTIRTEENTEELRKLLNSHLNEHKQEKGWKIQMRAAIAGGLSGAVAGFFLSLFLRFFR